MQIYLYVDDAERPSRRTASLMPRLMGVDLLLVQAAYVQSFEAAEIAMAVTQATMIDQRIISVVNFSMVPPSLVGVALPIDREVPVFRFLGRKLAGSLSASVRALYAGLEEKAGYSVPTFLRCCQAVYVAAITRTIVQSVSRAEARAIARCSSMAGPHMILTVAIVPAEVVIVIEYMGILASVWRCLTYR